MKFLLVLASLEAVNGIDFHGMVSPAFQKFACEGANCHHNVSSILQLHACGSAAMLGTRPVSEMIHCELFDNEKDCVGSKNPKCQWVDNDDDNIAMFGPGACAHGDFYDIFVASGLSVFYETLRKTGGKNLPAAPEIYDCIQHSFGSQADCEKEKDRKQRPCGWCPNVASDELQFTTPAFKNVCTQKQWLDVTCPQFQMTAEYCGGTPPPTTAPGSTSGAATTVTMSRLTTGTQGSQSAGSLTEGTGGGDGSTSTSGSSALELTFTLLVTLVAYSMLH